MRYAPMLRDTYEAELALMKQKGLGTATLLLP
jgi:hypothetical protein